MLSLSLFTSKQTRYLAVYERSTSNRVSPPSLGSKRSKAGKPVNDLKLTIIPSETQNNIAMHLGCTEITHEH